MRPLQPATAHPGETAWYIDALDALGGLAFASRRRPEVSDGYAESEATMFIGPPSFVPEPVASRSTALAASRGAFQDGFFLGGVEVAFEQLTHVAEFVRRLYVIGASGPETEGGGPPPVPTPPDTPVPPGESAAPSDERRSEDAGQRLAVELSAFSSFVAAADAENGARDCTWSGLAKMSAPAAPSPLWPDATTARAYAALLAELMARRPQPADPDLVPWMRSTSALLMLARSVGLPVWPTLSELRDASNGRWSYRWYSESALPLADPYEAMRLVPVPAKIARLLAPTEYQRLSLAGLLDRIVASPNAISMAADPRVADLVVFAAAAIASVDVDGLGIIAAWNDDWPVRPPWTDDPPDFVVSLRQELMRSAFTWLSESLPRFAFTSAIERALAAAVPNGPRDVVRPANAGPRAVAPPSVAETEASADTSSQFRPSAQRWWLEGQGGEATPS